MIVPIRNLNWKKKIPLPDSYPTPLPFNNGDWSGSGVNIVSNVISSYFEGGNHSVSAFSKVFESKSVHNIHIRAYLQGNGDSDHPNTYVSNGVYVQESDDQVTWTDVDGISKSFSWAPSSYHYAGEFTADVSTPAKKYFRLHYWNSNGQGQYSSWGTNASNELREITFS